MRKGSRVDGPICCLSRHCYVWGQGLGTTTARQMVGVGPQGPASFVIVTSSFAYDTLLSPDIELRHVDNMEKVRLLQRPAGRTMVINISHQIGKLARADR